MDLTGFTALIFIALVSALAFWRPTPILFMILLGASWAFGLSAPDLISSEAATTPFDMTVTVSCIIYGLLCAGWALRLMFWTNEGGT